MKLRFSRSSLNIIIFTCIILIGWASIDKNRKLTDQDNAAEAVTTIELLPLEPLKQQSWTSQEGVKVTWQSRLDTDFLIRVRATRPKLTSSINNNQISWSASYFDWDINLGPDFESGLASFSQQLQRFPKELKGQAGVITLQGPWSGEIARLTSARIIKDLALKNQVSATQAIKSAKHHCPWQPVSAQFWLRDQLANPELIQPNMANKSWQLKSLPTFSSISNVTLNHWKQTFIQQWQTNWLNPQIQFDMLTELAYYRLPTNYLLQGYWQINELTPAALEQYLSQCRKDVR